MRAIRPLLPLLLLVVGAVAPQRSDVTIQRLTPVVSVEEIEPCLPFWTEGLGFSVAIEVPADDRLGFVILEKDGAELMYQSRKSLEEDLPAATQHGRSALLYIEVDDLDALIDALEGHEIVTPLRTTSYGAREIFYRAPCGSIVGLSQIDRP